MFVFSFSFDVITSGFLTLSTFCISGAPEGVPRCRRKTVVVRAWPRATNVPPLDDPGFEKWALCQLRLYKPFRSLDELCSPTITDVFFSYLNCGRFPHLRKRDANDDGADIEDRQSGEPAVSLMGNIDERENALQQDDYQMLMNVAGVRSDSSFLLGNREVDITHCWPSVWQGHPFDELQSWLNNAKNATVIPAPLVDAMDISRLSKTQRKAYDIVHRHTFGNSQHEQMLLIVVGTAGTGKSFLINAIRQLYYQRNCSQSLKVTAPTGIAASNIYGCTVYSLLGLMNEELNGEQLHSLQATMSGVNLLIIDEYSFLSIAVIDALDRRLRVVFPRKSDIPFGGMNILLSGDPAQLPPVRAQPVYAYSGVTSHVAARFHLFNKVVELDQPFRQTGEDATQTHFRALLARVANCDATEDDWKWLQTRAPSRLSKEENVLFDECRHVVSTNDARHAINREKLARLSPVINIDDCGDEAVGVEDEPYEGNCYGTDNSQLFAVGAEVMMVMNLWTDAGLVNGACGTVIDILKPDDGRKTRVLLVDFPSYRGPVLSTSHPTVVPITQVSSRKIKGIPLTLSWAITIHKSQGMTLNRLTIDLGHTEYSSGLTFVALSRAKSFSGLRIKPFEFKRYRRIMAGKYVLARRSEFGRLRSLAAATS